MRRTKHTIRRCQMAALATGALGSAACVLAFFIAPRLFWPAYHVSFLFWWQITIGFLGFALLRCIIRSHWGNATWPYLIASLRTVPVVAMMFIPIALQLRHIFPWAADSHTSMAHENAFQAVYLEPFFFQCRSLGYFIIWFGCAVVAARTGTVTGEARLPRWFAAFSLIGLILSSTFAAFDWGMSLEPEWYSTIYGAMVLMSGALGSLSILVLSLVFLFRIPRVSGVRMRYLLGDLGNLLLAFLMIWSYFAFSQYLIIWSGNLPAEVTWYLRRSAGSWQAVLIGVVLFHFVVPFFWLLSAERKQHPRSLGRIAFVLLLANLLQSIWNYAPAFADEFGDLPWSLLCALLALGGWWGLAYTLSLGRALQDYSNPEDSSS